MKAGITGHQNLRGPNQIAWLELEIENSLSLLKVDLGYTSLAIGADQLFAEILRKNNIPYCGILPCKNYLQTFKTAVDRARFTFLSLNAVSNRTLDFIDPSENAFLEAGKTIVDLSEILVAIWDGQPAKGRGGTAEIVAYAQKLAKPILHLNLVAMTVEKV